VGWLPERLGAHHERLAVAREHQHIVPLAHGPSRLFIERCEIDSCRRCQLAELPRSDPLSGLAKDRRFGVLEAWARRLEEGVSSSV